MKESIKKFSDIIRETYKIDPSLYSKYSAKRGLRNEDGTGVLVGLTNIGNVHGYIFDEGDKIPDKGCLSYRGIDVSEIIANCEKENRDGFEEVAYLLIFGLLPTRRRLDEFKTMLSKSRELPEGFTEDMILKAPSNDVMNKLARCVLACYSYDSNPDDTSIENMLRQSMELIARFPTMVAYAYQAKEHYYDKKSLIIHTPVDSLSTAENFLYMLRPDNKYTPLEARVLDTALILHA